MNTYTVNAKKICPACALAQASGSGPGGAPRRDWGRRVRLGVWGSCPGPGLCTLGCCACIHFYECIHLRVCCAYVHSEVCVSEYDTDKAN